MRITRAGEYAVRCVLYMSGGEENKIITRKEISGKMDIPDQFLGKIAQQLGPPTNVSLRFAPDDIVALQAHVASPQLGPPTHLFAGVKDSVPPEPEDFEGILNIYRSLREIPGYLGAWPQPGTLDRLPLGLGVGQPVGGGISRLIGGLYRYTDGKFSILSFQRDVMEASIPWPVCTYQFCLSGTASPAAFHSEISFLLVPELSPRLTKTADLAAMVFRAPVTDCPLMPAESAGGPMMTKSLNMTCRRPMP